MSFSFSKLRWMIAAASLATMLAGCTPPEPTMFGVPQSQWQQLSPSEKQQVIQGYNQRQQINAQNAPLNNAIGSAAGLIRNDNYYKHNPNSMMPPPPNW